MGRNSDTARRQKGEKKMPEIKLKPCPVCGKKPKIKRDYSYEANGYGAWCTIQCKPFMRKPHLKVEEGKARWDRALKYGIERWNRSVDYWNTNSVADRS